MLIEGAGLTRLFRFGATKNAQLVVGSDEIAAIRAHLNRLGAADHPPNVAMLDRIEDAISSGRPLTTGERNFLIHELVENQLMNRALDAGMAFDEAASVAHDLAQLTHPNFANYDPAVISEFAEHFNPNWFDYWGLRW